ncbi:hypothetical protein AgCh_032200 [Apium graveolens]
MISLYHDFTGAEMRTRVMRFPIIPFDVMHVEKNVFDNVFNTVMNVTGKTKDIDKACLDLKDICRRPALELRQSSNGKTVKPHARWMYPFERLMGMLKRAVKNRACVEGSICEAYSFIEISMFFSDYFLNEVLKKANRVSRNDDGGNVELNGGLSIFGLSYGKGKHIFLSETYLYAAHTYILLNCEEIDEFVRAYGCGKRTTITGLCILGDCYNELSHAFYGELEEIIELSYKGTYGGYINLFKCRWFDSEKGIHVDRHEIVDIDVHKSAYSNEPFILPTQTKQVYYTPSPSKRRDRPPSDWQTIIHTLARRCEEVVIGEFYQEEMLRRSDVINVEDNELMWCASAHVRLTRTTKKFQKDGQQDQVDMSFSVSIQDFADHKIVKCISQLCFQNWPTPAITWASTPLAHKNAVWAEFQKCATWKKDMIAKDRGKALHNAGIDYEDKDAMEHMHKYSPWWCTADIWEAMCNQWRDEKCLKKGKIASSNRAAGGEKVKGTYKGSGISQLQHIVVRESESQGPVNWVDVYSDYRRLFDERYPEGTEHPYFDQELWDKAAKVKKNYGKGLLRILGGHLEALDTEELARAVVEVNASQQRDDSEGAHCDDHDDEFGGSS